MANLNDNLPSPPARDSDSTLRRLRRRLSNLQSLLYFPAGRIMLAWRWALHRWVRVDRRGPAFDFIRRGKPYIFVFWHQDVFPLMFEMSRGMKQTPHLFMVSLGRTGNIGAYLLSLMGVTTVAGSGPKKGKQAIRRIAGLIHKQPQPVYIMGDGSRGPNQELRWGALHLARHTGLPIIAGRAWGDNLVMLRRTWMRLVLPLPWGRAVMLTSEPLYVPRYASKEDLQVCHAELQKRMDELVRASEDYFGNSGSAEAFGEPVPTFPKWGETECTRTEKSFIAARKT